MPSKILQTTGKILRTSGYFLQTTVKGFNFPKKWYIEDQLLKGISDLQDGRANDREDLQKRKEEIESLFYKADKFNITAKIKPIDSEGLKKMYDSAAVTAYGKLNIS